METKKFWSLLHLVMMNRNERGDFYSKARGEILGFLEEKLVRKQFTSALSLIKNERQGIEDDQIPS